MTDLVQCSRCNKKMINEEYDSHSCSPKFNGIIKKVEIANYYTTKDDRGRDMIESFSLDGSVYQWVIVPEDKENTKIPYQTPNLNRDKNNDKTPTGEQKY